MRFLAVVVHRVTGNKFTDVTSGYRAFGRDAVHLLAREFPSRYLADTVEVLLIVHDAGLVTDEIPVSMRARTIGTSSAGSVAAAGNCLRLLVDIARRRYHRASADEASEPMT